MKLEIEEKNKIIDALKPDEEEEDEEIIEESQSPEGDVEKRNPLNKDTSENLCNICNRKFVRKIDLERHIEDKHNILKCPLCEKIFKNKQDLILHIEFCINKESIADKECHYCKEKFTEAGLKKHIENNVCKGSIICDECGMICNDREDLQNHKNNEHERISERVVCKIIGIVDVDLE